jgi:hypothetical protein
MMVRCPDRLRTKPTNPTTNSKGLRSLLKVTPEEEAETDAFTAFAAFMHGTQGHGWSCNAAPPSCASSACSSFCPALPVDLPVTAGLKVARFRDVFGVVAVAPATDFLLATAAASSPRDLEAERDLLADADRTYGAPEAAASDADARAGLRPLRLGGIVVLLVEHVQLK